MYIGMTHINVAGERFKLLSYSSNNQATVRNIRSGVIFRDLLTHFTLKDDFVPQDYYHQDDDRDKPEECETDHSIFEDWWE